MNLNQVTVDVADIPRARAFYLRLGFDSGPVDQTWLWREAWLRDPDGNRLSLYFAGENRVDPPWRVAGPIGTA